MLSPMPELSAFCLKHRQQLEYQLAPDWFICHECNDAIVDTWEHAPRHTVGLHQALIQKRGALAIQGDSYAR